VQEDNGLFQAVFFDMGGTLSTQEPAREDILQEYLRRKGYAFALQPIRAAYLAADLSYCEWAASTPREERTEAAYQRLLQHYQRTFLQNLNLRDGDGWLEEMTALFQANVKRRHNVLYPDVRAALATLRGHGLRLGIVSNWDLSLEDHVHDLGLEPYLDTVVGSQAVGSEKPQARIFQIALAQVGVAAPEALHVGDMYPADVLGARAAGLTPVLIDRYDLQPQADCRRVRSLKELPAIIAASLSL
jgi:putative hydrolase of the HAD superfamily